MFEVGKHYRVTMVEGGEEGYATYLVADWQPPLLVLSNPHTPDMIVNTHSPQFVRAELSDRKAVDIPTIAIEYV